MGVIIDDNKLVIITEPKTFVIKRKEFLAEHSNKEFIVNKIPNKVVKAESMSDMNSRNIEGIVILPEKRQEILNKLIHVF